MTIQFVDGKAVVREGRKTIAKVFDRPVFFKGTRYENNFGRYRYSVEMYCGQKECSTIEEVIETIEGYK